MISFEVDGAIVDLYMTVRRDYIDRAYLEWSWRMLADLYDWQIAATLQNRAQVTRALRVEMLG